jgi:hypothetical protein
MADLTITLRPEEWNVVLDVLADGRHRLVAPVIQRIVEQAQAAQQQQQPEQPGQPQPPRLAPVS